MDITIDSGACDTVIPTGECSWIPIVDGPLSLEGSEYEVANGEGIPNLGERRCIAMTEGGGSVKEIHWQVADVHKTLLSLSKLADMGFDSHLSKNGGYLIDTVTGEQIPMRRKGNVYTMKMWVKAKPPTETAGPFGRRG